MSLKNFGLYFAEIREMSGYRSQRELAEKSGVSHSTINRIESGTHKTSPETLRQLAQYLKGVSYEELMEQMGYLGDDNYETREHVKQWSQSKGKVQPDIKYSIPKKRNVPPEEVLEEPGVQFIMRAKEKMNPKAYEKFLKLMAEAEKAFDDDDE